jgi:CRP/FNR family cyclic AMP-dependent transcriptional regulator
VIVDAVAAMTQRQSPSVQARGIVLMTGTAKLSFDADAFEAKHGGVTKSERRENTVIFAQGDPADAVFYIQRGRVNLSVLSEQGKERVISVPQAGDLCGEECLADQPLRTSTATTMTGCAIIRLGKAAVAGAVHNDLSFSEFFVSCLLARNVRLRADLIDHLFNSSERRLARVLLLLANYEKNREEAFLPNINQDTLAKMVGTTRPRVNHFMNKFRRLGYIDYNGHIKVHHSLLNVLLQDQSQLDAS